MSAGRVSRQPSAFERHGIEVLSATSLNQWAAAPALWVIQRLLRRRSPQSAFFARGKAVEHGVHSGLLEPTLNLDACTAAAEKAFDREMALVPDPRREKERNSIRSYVASALGELRHYGVPTGYQERIEVRLDDVPVPLVGYPGSVAVATMRREPPSRRIVDRSVDLMAPIDIATRAIVDGLDEVAARMERRWGVGRLRLLVPDELRFRFDAQKTKLDAAIATDEDAYVRVQAEGMRRAWLALDRAATEAGAEALSPQVWECVLPASGEVVSIVRAETEAHHVAREGEVWTLAEVGVLIERMGDEVRQVKRTFPGSAVVEVRDREVTPVDWEKGDEIPF